MEPLKTARHVLTWLSAYPADENIGKWRKVGYVTFSSTVLLGISLYSLESCLFFSKNVSSNLEASLLSVFQIVGTASVLYISVAGILSRYKFQASYNKLLQIYSITGEILFVMIINIPKLFLWNSNWI